MFNNVRKKINTALEQNKKILAERKAFKEDLKKRILVERRKAFKREAVIQARKSAKSLAKEKYGPNSDLLKESVHNFGLDHKFGFDSEELPKKKKKHHFDDIGFNL